MSIVIKSNELNTLVYKYLLEAGLNHTAYTMFNEAKLQSPLQQFKYDIKSGHLLSLLQKGLILSQIQSHVNFGAHQQCLEPFSLLKPHTCLITQSRKQSQVQFMAELNQNITECIKRTNAVYNTELANKNYEEILYDPRGVNYFDKFQKFKFTDIQTPEQTQNDISESRKPNALVKVDGQKDHEIAIWYIVFNICRNKHQHLIYIVHKTSLDDTIISKLYPCTLGSQLQHLNAFKLTHTHLIMIFNSNRAKLISRDNDHTVEFVLPLKEEIEQIEVNKNVANLVIFRSKCEYFVLNIKNLQEIMSGKGTIAWRGFDEYIIWDNEKLELRSLIKEEPLIVYEPLETNPQLIMSQISISQNMTFFFTLSCDNTKLWVHTFQKPEPLYTFDFTENTQKLKQAIWTHRNGVDYLCLLTDTTLRVWEVELNSYCLKIELASYDLREVYGIVSLEKSQTETFLLVLGSGNLLVTDIANQKNERIESPINCTQMENVGRDCVYVATDQHVYFLDGERLADLFK